jgi:hypothetical protein
VNTCFCGSAATRLYAEGHRCPAHTPAARAGKPEPDIARYCAPLRCYCGGCPSWTPDTSYHVGETVLDVRAVASGKRRSSLEQYRSAQQNMTGGAA